MIPITENKKPNKEGETIIYRNVDLRDLPKGESIKIKNLGEPMILDGEYGKRFMFKFITEDNKEVTTFINETMKATGPEVPFGTKVHELLTQKTGDLIITRIKSSSKGKLKGPDVFDLWSIKNNAESSEQVTNTAAAVAPKTEEGELLLLPPEQGIIDMGLKGKPFEQIKELFDAVGTNEERAKKIYSEYMQ